MSSGTGGPLALFRDREFLAFTVCGIADSIRLPASMALFVEEGEHFDAVAGSLSLRSLAWMVGQVVGPVTVGAL